MPSHSKGARLWLRPERRNAKGELTHPAVYLIREPGRGGKAVSTGCGKDDIAGAQKALLEHLGKAHVAAAAEEGPRDPTLIKVADVIALYARDIVPKHARPPESAARLARLLEWWQNRPLSSVTGATCRAYAKGRKPQAARRELEELRAAINHHRTEGLCEKIVSVPLPERSPHRERWCSRDEVARLVWAAWRYRETQKGVATDRRTRRHVARFILAAVYTGSRAATVCGAALGPTEGRGWIDLERGIFYRRPAGARETKKRRPAVPLPERLMVHLRRWRRIGQRSIVEFDGRAVKDVDKAFRAVARDAGLPDVTPHVLRHTCATWLMQRGTDKWEAAEFLGMTAEMLERVYGHHHPDHLLGARKALDSRPHAHVVAKVVA